MLITSLPNVFEARRKQLITNHPGAAFLFPANLQTLRNPDVHYPFRQESNFYYLTGFEEPESFLVLSPKRSKPGQYQMTLFVLPRDPEKEMWEGERYGTEGAVQIFGAHQAYPIHELETHLAALLEGSDRIFYRAGMDTQTDQRVFTALEKLRRSQGRSGKSLLPLFDPNEVLGEMRLFKSPEEITLLRKACKITALAHRAIMQEARPGMNEYEVEAFIDYYFRKNGCERVGYGSIVAGGKNATCLHYRSNNEPLRKGELLLIDAGGEHQYYTSDITRTFPISPEFTRPQARLYEIVLKAQKEAIAMTRPGVTLPEIHEQVCMTLIDGLLSADLLTGNPKDIFKNKDYRRFYPHNTSHWLGMDVHDVGLYLDHEEPRKLEPGMVFTIEPGLYVQPTDLKAPDSYRNIGIRIEDDILVTPQGHEILTQDAPKERGEIESIRSSAG